MSLSLTCLQTQMKSHQCHLLSFLLRDHLHHQGGGAGSPGCSGMAKHYDTILSGHIVGIYYLVVSFFYLLYGELL